MAATGRQGRPTGGGPSLTPSFGSPPCPGGLRGLRRDRTGNYRHGGAGGFKAASNPRPQLKPGPWALRQLPAPPLKHPSRWPAPSPTQRRHREPDWRFQDSYAGKAGAPWASGIALPPDSTRPWMLQMTGDPVRLPRPEPREGRAGASVDDHKRRIGFLRDCLHRAQADIKACQDENKRLKRALDKKDPLCRDCHNKATFPATERDRGVADDGRLPHRGL